MRRFKPLPLTLLAGLAALAVFAGCSHETDKEKVNQAPFIRITGGPLNQSVASYTARIFWTGWDEDGIVDHYEYALDPPAEFTDEEIRDPAAAGLTITVIPGPAEDTDTLRVSKPGAGGGTVSFRWIQTREFSRAFAFQTPNPDSVTVGGQRQAGSTFSGNHIVYVRAQDDDGMFSNLDYIEYTATTIVPSSEITRPDVGGEILNLGTVLTLTWDGLDSDSPDPNKRPVAYIYKILRLDTLEPPVPITSATNPTILYSKGSPVWTYQNADTLSKTLQLAANGRYVFGVRAVDLAGGVESKLDYGRNAFRFQAFSTGGKPTLTICEKAVGCNTFRGTSALPVEVEVPAGRLLKFTWSATAVEYGGEIEAFSWGLDIPDLEQEGPESGWSAWGKVTGNQQAIVFNLPSVHVLYVRVRDVAGTVTLGTLILNIVDFPLDKEVLFLDDSFDDTWPRDSEHDAFWAARFQNYGKIDPARFGVWEMHGPLDRGSLEPRTPKLVELGRYQTLVWDNRGSGYNGVTGLIKLAALRPVLSSYLGAGGELWLSGRMTIAATTPDPSGRLGDLAYPKLEFVPGDFAYDFLKLHTNLINNDKGVSSDGRHNMSEAQPFPGRTEIYPLMQEDQLKQNPVARGRGIPYVDAVFDPLFAHSEPDFRGTIDSLYVYGATGNVLLGKSSLYHQKLTGIRWHDPDPARDQGRIQWFGFPMYFLMDAQAQETLNRSLDWFREEGPGSP